ncbi:MAG: sugar ABC transporter ATP-binding protein [Christensenellales bacterium]
MSHDDKLVVMEEIDKAFPGVQALDHCKFDLMSGEVHALVGENGAGKSTLMKVLSGVYQMDAGKIFFKGKPVHIPSTRAALDTGITIIHQELQLIPHLTVAQNIFIGREPRKRFKIMVDERLSNQKAQELIDRMKINLDPTQRVMDLSVAEQYMVEIAKAVAQETEVLIMDEPTAALTDTETQDLFSLICDMKQKGMGIVYISHRMEELKQISDRITVMRDGHYIDTRNTVDTQIDDIISMMVGRTIYETTPDLPEHPSTETVLKVEGLTCGNRVRNVSFELKKGEILGLSGLVGAGRTEVARAIFGADRLDAGSIYVNGKKVRIKHPADAVRHGIGYLSEDRKRYGLTLGRDVESNIVLASYRDFVRFKWVVNSKKTSKAAQEMVQQLNIMTPSLKQIAKNLSGGNQQKVVIAKWLVRNSDILIFDEPTRGIDVGAKSEIYKLLNRLAKQGKSIIMISSELPEILRMSHRVLVMCEGELTGELDCCEATQESIMKCATRRVIGG